MKLEIGDKIKVAATGIESTIIEIKSGNIIVDYDGKDNKIHESTLIAHIDQGIFELIKKEQDTSRQVTFMNVTTTINPLKDRDELQQRMEKGLITPLAYYHGLRATWNNMNDSEKLIEFKSLN